MNGHKYIYVKDWEEHQVRSDRPNMPWIKLKTDLLGNDAWLGLSAPDRVLLITIWLLVQRHGNGRVIASLSWLQGQANLPLSNAYRGLERLTQAGFITLSDTKATPKRLPDGGLEERRGTTSLREEKNARDDAAENGAPRRSEEEQQERLVEAIRLGYQPGWMTPEEIAEIRDTA